jgi:hypothetical protein
MDRSYGTLSTIRSFFNRLKSVATIWFIPTEFLNGLRESFRLLIQHLKFLGYKIVFGQ